MQFGNGPAAVNGDEIRNATVLTEDGKRKAEVGDKSLRAIEELCGF